ncbi:MAG: 2-oxoacid:acceptor oxidoreductase family protein [Candidatus Bathyarchaeia archaeon]
MIEIRLHGRGGQGAILAALIVAEAAFHEGKYSQKIPIYGGERRGAPVMAFLRIDDKPIHLTSAIYEPDCIIVLSDGLYKIVNVTDGLKESGVALINDRRDPEVMRDELGVKLAKVATVDATAIATKTFGRTAIPITNTTMMGALSAATGWIRVESLFEPIMERFPGRLGERNIKAVREGYDSVKVKEF